MSAAAATAGHAGVRAAASPFTSRWLDADGGRLHYVDEGPRTGTPVLCVHGNPTSSYYWRRLVAGLTAVGPLLAGGAPTDQPSGEPSGGRGRRVIALDHIGFGLSDKPAGAGHSLERHVANLERLVLALDLRDVALAVHDWGGPIGLGVARRQPARFARLVVTNTAAFRSRRIPLRIAACRWPLVGPAAVLGLNAFARAAVHMAVERPLAPDVRAAYLAPFARREQRAGVLAFVRDIPLRAGHPSWAELVAIESSLEHWVDRPVLIAWGERDWCFTPAFREEWQRRLPRAEVRRFERAGHWLLEDEPGAVVDAVRAFLDRTEGAT